MADSPSADAGTGGTQATDPGPLDEAGDGEGTEDVPPPPPPPIPSLAEYLAAVKVTVTILEKMDRTIAVMEKELANSGTDSPAGRAQADTPKVEDQVLRVRLEAVRNDVLVVTELLRPLVGPFETPPTYPEPDATPEPPATSPPYSQPPTYPEPDATPEPPATSPPYSQPPTPSPSSQPSAASSALQQAREGLGTVTASLEKARDALERREQRD
jgi:hypothetical protein